jgi:transposase-like protein
MKVDMKKACLFFCVKKIRGEKMSRQKGGKNRRWSKAEKLEIVKRYLESGVGRHKFAAGEGIASGQLYTWTKKYMEEGEEGLENQKKPGNAYSALHTSKRLTELERLELTVAKQKVEISRLKKGYRVKGGGADRVFVTTSGVNIKS